MSAPDRLLLDERILADGSISRTWGALADGRLAVSDDDGTRGELSLVAVDRVMCRYGRPLDPGIELSQLSQDRPALDLGMGHRLSRLRFRAAVDADGRDYLVWERPGDPPLAVLATHVTAALRYLVLRLSGERPQETEV
jgi:hypothetical protein